jgi:hypothetical protein
MESYLLENEASLRVSAFLLALFADPTVSTTFLGALGIPFRAAVPQEVKP